MGLSVVQSWVEELPLRMQSVMLLGLRGPDHERCPEIKKMTRWLRGLVLRPANPHNVVQFMRAEPPERIKEKSLIHRELEFVPMHYYTHLMHVLEVIGYRHPNEQIREHGLWLFFDMCRLLHLPPESDAEFSERLRQFEWPGGTQPETGLDAFEIMLNSGELSDRDQDFMNRSER